MPNNVREEMMFTFRTPEGELVAVLEKNGKTAFSKASEMSRSEVAELLGADLVKHDTLSKE